LKYEKELTGLGNALRIAVANPNGSIYDAHYLELLRQFSDEVFLLPGVDRVQMTSLWTPSTRWIGVTEEGLDGGPVIPEGYDGSPASLQILKVNVARSGQIGQLIAADEESTIIYMPLLNQDATGEALDYAKYSKVLEDLRTKYQAEGLEIPYYRFH